MKILFAFGRCLLLVALCAIPSLLVLEFGARALFPHADPRGKILLQVDEKTRCLGGDKSTVTRQWNAVGEFDVEIAVNRHGFRDDKDFAQAAPDAIYAVGDSFTMGMGVEEKDRYTEEIERQLHRPIYNIGIVGDFNQYGSFLRCARDGGARIRNLLIGVYMENDLKRYGCDSKPKSSSAGKGDAAPEKAKSAQKSGPGISARILAALHYREVKNWLHFNSTAYNFIAELLPRNPTVRRFLLDVGLMYQRRSCEVTLDSNPDDVVQASAERLYRLAQPYNSVIILLPSKKHYPENVPEVWRKLERRLHTSFAAALRSRGLRVIDLLDVFDRAGGVKYYYKVDGHWNASGHRLAGRAIAAELEKMKPF